jgi:hypothetical protein
MKHEFLIKTIHNIFNTNWNDSYVHFDSSDVVKDKEEWISLKYIPKKSEYAYLGVGDEGIKKKGELRVFVYSKNPTKNMALLDKVIGFLKDKTIDNVYFKELESFQSPQRNDNSSSYVSFVDFEVCTF